MVDVGAQGIAQADGGGADDFAVSGDVGEGHAGDHAVAAGGEVIKVAAAG